MAGHGRCNTFTKREQLWLWVPACAGTTLVGLSLRRHLPQTLPAQAALAGLRHRQPRGFFRTPAGAGEFAGKLSAAAAAGEAAHELPFGDPVDLRQIGRASCRE